MYETQAIYIYNYRFSTKRPHEDIESRETLLTGVYVRFIELLCQHLW